MYEYKCQIDRVVDGDTVDVVLDLGFSILHKARVRLYAIDTPEWASTKRARRVVCAPSDASRR